MPKEFLINLKHRPDTAANSSQASTRVSRKLKTFKARQDSWIKRYYLLFSWKISWENISRVLLLAQELNIVLKEVWLHMKPRWMYKGINRLHRRADAYGIQIAGLKTERLQCNLRIMRQICL